MSNSRQNSTKKPSIPKQPKSGLNTPKKVNLSPDPKADKDKKATATINTSKNALPVTPTPRPTTPKPTPSNKALEDLKSDFEQKNEKSQLELKQKTEEAQKLEMELSKLKETMLKIEEERKFEEEKHTIAIEKEKKEKAEEKSRLERIIREYELEIQKTIQLKKDLMGKETKIYEELQELAKQREELASERKRAGSVTEKTEISELEDAIARLRRINDGLERKLQEKGPSHEEIEQNKKIIEAIEKKEEELKTSQVSFDKLMNEAKESVKKETGDDQGKIEQLVSKNHLMQYQMSEAIKEQKKAEEKLTQLEIKHKQHLEEMRIKYLEIAKKEFGINIFKEIELKNQQLNERSLQLEQKEKQLSKELEEAEEAKLTAELELDTYKFNVSKKLDELQNVATKYYDDKEERRVLTRKKEEAEEKIKQLQSEIININNNRDSIIREKDKEIKLQKDNLYDMTQEVLRLNGEKSTFETERASLNLEKMKLEEEKKQEEEKLILAEKIVKEQIEELEKEHVVGRDQLIAEHSKRMAELQIKQKSVIEAALEKDREQTRQQIEKEVRETLKQSFIELTKQQIVLTDKEKKMKAELTEAMNKQLAHEIESVKATHAKALETEYNEGVRRLQVVVKERDELLQKTKTQKEENEMESKRVQEKDKQISELTQTTQSLSSQILSLQQSESEKAKEQEGKLSDLNEQIKNLRKAIDQNASEAKDRDQKLQNEKKRADLAEQAKQQLESEKSRREKEEKERSEREKAASEDLRKQLNELQTNNQQTASQLEKKNSENTTLQNQISSTESTNQTLTQQVSTLTQQLAGGQQENRNQVDSLTLQNQLLQQQLQDWENEQKRLEQLREEKLRKEKETHDEELKNLEQKLKEEKERADRESRAKNELIKNQKNLEEKKQEEEKQREETKKNIDSQITELTKTNASLQTQVKKLEEKQSEASDLSSKKISELQNELQQALLAAKNSQSQHESELAKLRLANEDLTKDGSNKTQAISALQDKLLKLRGELREQKENKQDKDKITRLSEEVNTLQQRLNELKEEKNEHDRKEREHKLKLQERDEEIRALKAAETKANEREKKLQDEKEKAERERNQRNDDLNKLKSELESKNKENKEHKEEEQKKDTQISNLTQKAEALQGQVSTLESKLNENGDLLGQIAELKSNLSTAISRDQYELLSIQYQELQTTLGQLQSENKKLQETNSSTATINQQLRDQLAQQQHLLDQEKEANLNRIKEENKKAEQREIEFKKREQEEREKYEKDRTKLDKQIKNLGQALESERQKLQKLQESHEQKNREREEKLKQQLEREERKREDGLKQERDLVLKHEKELKDEIQKLQATLRQKEQELKEKNKDNDFSGLRNVIRNRCDELGKNMPDVFDRDLRDWEDTITRDIDKAYDITKGQTFGPAEFTNANELLHRAADESGKLLAEFTKRKALLDKTIKNDKEAKEREVKEDKVKRELKSPAQIVIPEVKDNETKDLLDAFHRVYSSNYYLLVNGEGQGDLASFEELTPARQKLNSLALLMKDQKILENCPAVERKVVEKAVTDLNQEFYVLQNEMKLTAENTLDRLAIKDVDATKFQNETEFQVWLKDQNFRDIDPEVKKPALSNSQHRVFPADAELHAYIDLEKGTIFHDVTAEVKGSGKIKYKMVIDHHPMTPQFMMIDFMLKHKAYCLDPITGNRITAEPGFLADLCKEQRTPFIFSDSSQILTFMRQNKITFPATEFRLMSSSSGSIAEKIYSTIKRDFKTNYGKEWVQDSSFDNKVKKKQSFFSSNGSLHVPTTKMFELAGLWLEKVLNKSHKDAFPLKFEHTNDAYLLAAYCLLYNERRNGAPLVDSFIFPESFMKNHSKEELKKMAKLMSGSHFALSDNGEKQKHDGHRLESYREAARVVKDTQAVIDMVNTIINEAPRITPRRAIK